MQSTTFDPDEVSDRDILPRTPTLAGSTSSLNDSLLQSPFSARFLGASASPPTKRSSYPGSRIALEGSCRAWWEGRISADSSDWRASLDLGPHGQVSGGISTRAGLEPLERSLSQSDETASVTPAPTPSCRRSISGAKGSPPPDVNAEGLGVERDAASESCSSRFQQTDAPSADFSQPSISPLPALDMSAANQQRLVKGADSTNVNEAPSNSSVPRLSIVHQSVDWQPLCGPSISLAPHLNISRANSSMLAHCEQSSLAPPCVSMTQTQCGRSALREAGIAHGSPRALASSPPIENVPNRSRNGGFFHRFVHKTFSKSSFAIPTTGSQSFLARSTAPNGNQKSRRSWPTRHGTTPLFAPAKTPSNGQVPPAPKRSPWTFIQRIIAKPSAAVKAAGAGITRRTRTQHTPSSADYTRRHTIISGHSSSASFFDDPLVLIDPFARPSRLGATVCSTDAGSPEPFWSEPPRIGEHDAHTMGFSVGETRGRSRGEDIDEAEVNSSSLPPDRPLCMMGASSETQVAKPMNRGMPSPRCHPTVKCIGRRYSAPMLSTLSVSITADQ